jgi:hypothetical protein
VTLPPKIGLKPLSLMRMYLRVRPLRFAAGDHTGFPLHPYSIIWFKSIAPLDKVRILQALTLPETAIIKLTHLDMLLWGRALHFQGVVDRAENDAVPFELQFEDCRELRWQIYSHLQSATPEAFPASELMNFQMGRNQQRSPARLLTEHFGLALFYGTLYLIHYGQVISLDT